MSIAHALCPTPPLRQAEAEADLYPIAILIDELKVCVQQPPWRVGGGSTQPSSKAGGRTLTGELTSPCVRAPCLERRRAAAAEQHPAAEDHCAGAG